VFWKLLALWLDEIGRLPASLCFATEVLGMKGSSDWQNRLGTIRVAALGVMVLAAGFIWYV